MKPYPHQEMLAKEGLSILRQHMICYLATEERTGKTLTAILMAEDLDISTVLVVTKKKAIDGWLDHLANYPVKKHYRVTTYGSVHKLDSKFDLVILDEAHNYISGYPKPSATWKKLKPFCEQRPIIYISATPYAQGPQLLYHQFALSSWSPWNKYKNFYRWFEFYGIPSTIWLYNREVKQYNKVKANEVLATCGHLFVTYTRKQLGFGHEPEDRLHYIKLSDDTRALYNKLLKDKRAKVAGQDLICDTPMKLRTSLHMLEGGVAKIEDEYYVLPNQEKIDYIKETWGDTKDIAIMYNYIAEGKKLRKHFRKALILQATTYAEGIDLAHIKDLIIYSQDFSTARHTQRRARQAAKHRKEPIVVHYLLAKKAVSEQVYNTVSVNKQNFVDSVFERTEI